MAIDDFEADARIRQARELDAAVVENLDSKADFALDIIGNKILGI